MRLLSAPTGGRANGKKSHLAAVTLSASLLLCSAPVQAAPPVKRQSSSKLVWRKPATQHKTRESSTTLWRTATRTP